MDQKDNDPLNSIRTGGGKLQQGNGRKDIADHSGTEALGEERTVDTGHAQGERECGIIIQADWR